VRVAPFSPNRLYALLIGRLDGSSVKFKCDDRCLVEFASGPLTSAGQGQFGEFLAAEIRCAVPCCVLSEPVLPTDVYRHRIGFVIHRSCSYTPTVPASLVGACSCGRPLAQDKAVCSNPPRCATYLRCHK